MNIKEFKTGYSEKAAYTDFNIKVFERDPPQNWDDPILAAGGDGSITQTCFHARFVARVDGDEPIYVQVWDSGELLCSLLLFKTKRPQIDTFRKAIVVVREVLAGRSLVRFVWYGGPVIYDEARVHAILNSLLQWVDMYAKKHGVTLIHADSLPRTGDLSRSNDIAAIYKNHGYSVRTWGTILVDISSSEDVIWSKIRSKKYRQAITKARRLGATVHQIHSIDELHYRYFLPYAAIKEREGLGTRSFDRFRAMYEEDYSRNYSFFVVENEDGYTLAVGGMYCFNSVATPIAVGTTSLAMKLKIPAMDLLHWHLILYAKTLGAVTYDFAGVNPDPLSEKEKRIRFTKEKWGGRYFEYFSFEKKSAYTRFVKKILTVVSGEVKSVLRIKSRKV